MKETAREIRAHLKELGYSSLSVSVRCKPSYEIKVSAKSPQINMEKLQAAVLEVYHRRPHAWLVVSVNNHYLPMPPVTGVQDGL